MTEPESADLPESADAEAREPERPEPAGCAGAEAQVRGSSAAAAQARVEQLSPDEPPAPALFAMLERHPSGAVLALAGELDLASIDLLHAGLDTLRREGHRQVAIDLDSLRFIDSSGIHAIFREIARCREDDVELTIRRVPPNILRTFQLVGLADLLPLAPQ